MEGSLAPSIPPPTSEMQVPGCSVCCGSWASSEALLTERLLGGVEHHGHVTSAGPVSRYGHDRIARYLKYYLVVCLLHMSVNLCIAIRVADYRKTSWMQSVLTASSSRGYGGT
jgi:hypothetical protein